MNRSISEFKNLVGNSYFDKLTCEGLFLIKKKIFPLKDFGFKSKLEHKINNFLIVLTRLSNSNNINVALNLIEKFAFNFCIRIYVIYLFKNQKPEDPFVPNLKLTNNNEALYFLNLTQLKNLKKSKPFKVLSFRIKIKKVEKHFEQSSILDQILQRQFKLLVERITRVKLHKSQFGFKKDESILQFMSKFYKCIKTVMPHCLNVLNLNIKNYFAFFSRKKILKKFPWPQKFIKLLSRWLNPSLIEKNFSLILMPKKGLLKKNVLTPLISTFLLGICLKTAASVFENTFGTKKNKRYGICLNFENTIVFCSNHKSTQKSFLLSFKTTIKAFDWFVNKKKTVSFKFSKPVKFNILNWTIRFKLKLSSLKKKFPKRMTYSYSILKTQTSTNFIWLLYPSKNNYTFFKKYVKQTIKKLTNKPLWVVLYKLNLLIKKFYSYCHYQNNFFKSTNLYYFCYQLWKKALIKKFRSKGVRRPKWVLQNFFNFNKIKYQICVKSPNKKFGLIKQILPLKIVSSFKLRNQVENNSYFFKKNKFLPLKFRQKQLQNFFFLKRRSKCLFCLKYIDYNLQNLTFFYVRFSINYKLNNIKVINDLILFHNWCHFLLNVKKFN